MTRRKILFAAALAAMSLLCPVAQAAGTPVTGDAGILGMFQLMNTGISASGVSTLVLSLPNSGAEMITSINASPIIVPASFTAPITLEVTPLVSGGYLIALSPATYTKTFGSSATGTAELTYNLTAGQVVTVGSFSFFNLAGLVTSVVADALPGFTFAPFANGLGLEGITLVAEGSFASVISTAGASITGSGSFSEVAIPEPVSVSLLGIGLSGLLTLRRFFKRTSIA
jgi:hypothetical protein